MIIIQFSHANGFPAPCYHQLLEQLGSEFEIRYLERIGHDPRFPVTDGWPHLVDELINTVSGQWREPVLGVGHSLGGFLTAIAAARRPDLFRAVILLDAPILSRFRGNAMQFIKHIGLIDRMTPAGITRNRRSEWPSREAALAHFERRRVFAKFDPNCLRDYVRYGLTESEHGLRLWFDPQIEYQIYRTLPHDMSRAVQSLRIPAGFIGGRESTVIKQMGLRLTERYFKVVSVAGGHHFPFQLPQVAASAIRRMAQELAAL